MESSDPYDLLIIGGGPAGLSAAANVVRQCHRTLLLDSGSYRNDGADHMHTVPTWDHRAPADFRAAAKKDLDRYGSVDIEAGEVTSVQKKNHKDTLFEATTADGKKFAARKVLLAAGVQDTFPDIPGYADCWISGIFHCLYCHGWEERGASSTGILAIGEAALVPVAIHFARQSLRLSESVTIYTHGNETLAKDLTAALQSPPVPAMQVDGRKIASFEKGPHKAEVVIHFEDGTTKTEGFLGHKPTAVLRAQHLIEELGVETTPQGTIKVHPPFNQTSVSGVFAAGDAASPMQTVLQALQSGGAAGVGAVLQAFANQLGQQPLV